MTREDRATSRPELASRVARLVAIVDGPRALEALGAYALCWHQLSTGAGFVPLTGRELAQALGVDERTWARLCRVLVGAGLLEVAHRGYQLVRPRDLEGTAAARGTAGYLRTYRPAYAQTVARVRAAGSGRRGAYVLASLGALELVRVLHVSWRNGTTQLPAAAASRAYGVSEKTWLGYLGLLSRALVLTRDGSRLRMLGWAALCFGPSWRRTAPAALEAIGVHKVPVSVDEIVHNLPDLSAAKARAEGKNSPLPPPPSTPPDGLSRGAKRRGEHPHLEALLTQLEATVPAAGQARWRRPVRAELSHALAAAAGDVGALVTALTQRTFDGAKDVPRVLVYRCGAAVEIVRARQAAQAAAGAAADVRAEHARAAADAAGQQRQEAAFGDRLASAAGERYLELLDLVAVDLGQPRPGSPTFRGGVQRVVEAAARVRVRAVSGISAADADIAREDLRAAVALVLDHAAVAEPGE
jgi:hypothetical protein